jgi:hypothetical protein
MAEIGIDLSGESPKALTEEAVHTADVIVTMGCGDACPVIPGKRYLDWDLQDPADKPVDQVRAIRDEIDRRVKALLNELVLAAVFLQDLSLRFGSDLRVQAPPRERRLLPDRHLSRPREGHSHRRAGVHPACPATAPNGSLSDPDWPMPVQEGNTRPSKGIRLALSNA